jgi:phytoene dehydrogenase-like protein
MTIIVGAGLSGLACALTLHRAGKPFLLLEAAPVVGGRQRTTHREGFTLDHGFQVVLSSYPSVAHLTSVGALQPRWFESGALLHNNGRLSHLASPLENPIAAVTSPALRFADKLRLAFLGAELLLQRDKKLLWRCGSASDTGTRTFLEQRGFSPAFQSSFAQPFFGGVLLDNDLSTSSGLFLYYLKKFITGRAWVPAGGIAALPASIAAQLPPQSIRVNARVAEISPGDTGVILESGEQIHATQLVLALDQPSLHRLLKLPPTSPARGVAVVYFKTRTSLYSNRCLVLPQGHARRVRHFVQITNIAPEFAPHGWHLISATVLNYSDLPGGQLVTEAAREITEIFPHAAGNLDHLETITVPYAVPSQPPGFSTDSLIPHLPQGVHAIGDWKGGACIQTALDSGISAAKKLVSL